MSQVSKRRLESQVRKDLLDSFTFVLKEVTKQREMESFLSSVMTETERTMLAKRVVVAFLLKNNVEEAKIAETIKVTPATVSRMKLWIQTHQEGYEVIFSKLEKEQNLRIAKQLLYRFLRYAIKSSSGRIPLPI